MTRMPIDDRLDGPEHELYDETPPRSIFAATWFRALLVLVVVVVVGAISAPYIFDAMNPSAKSTLASRGVATSTPADTRVSIGEQIIGVSQTGSNCLLVMRVSGCNLEPVPPARMTPL